MTTTTRAESDPVRKRNRRAKTIAEEDPEALLKAALRADAITLLVGAEGEPALRMARCLARIAKLPASFRGAAKWTWKFLPGDGVKPDPLLENGKVSKNFAVAAYGFVPETGEEVAILGPQIAAVFMGTPQGEREHEPLLLLRADLPVAVEEYLEVAPGVALAYLVLDWLLHTPAGNVSALTLVVEKFVGVPVAEDPHRTRTGRTILPHGLLPAAPGYRYVAVRDRGDPGLVLPGQVDEGEPTLPFGLPGSEDRAPLVRLADAAGMGGLVPGRGARLDKRLFIYAVGSMPRQERESGVMYRHERSLRWWAAVLWPGGGYRPHKHQHVLNAALKALIEVDIRLPDGSSWLPVVPRRLPRYDDPGSIIRLDIELPADSTRGAGVSWPRLIEAGGRSDPVFDTIIGLAYLWDRAKARNGGRRVYATRPRVRRNHAGALVDRNGDVITSSRGAPRLQPGTGQPIWDRGDVPVTNWQHPAAVYEGTERHPAAGRVELLTRARRRKLVFPNRGQDQSKSARSNDQRRAEGLLREMAKRGEIVIEVLPDRLWRILEAAPKIERAGGQELQCSP